MTIFAFILIGGIWAAFLLPSVLDGRREAPMSSTRSFARSQDLLASVAVGEAKEARQRRRNSDRRRRVLIALGAGALISLVVAITQGSTTWLAVTILFDVAFAGFVTLLLHTQQTAPMRAPVVPLRLVEEPEETASTVRVVAG
jgi:peptidoglycan/LPS O-acetylase OafA/YrhL